MWLAKEGLRGKEVPKVWIHSDIKSNHVETVVTQGEMIQQLVQLTERLHCPRSQGITSASFGQLGDTFQWLYSTHSQQPAGYQPRKRVVSYMQTKDNRPQTNARPEEPLSSQIDPTSTRIDVEPSTSPIVKLGTIYNSPMHNQGKSKKADIFYRPPHTSFKKVNFSYAKGGLTPKHYQSYENRRSQNYENRATQNYENRGSQSYENRGSQPTNCRSPQQLGLNRTTGSPCPSGQVRTSEHPRQELKAVVVPAVSRFSINDIQEEQFEDGLKDVVSTDRLGS